MESTAAPAPRPLYPELVPAAVVFDCDGVLLDTESAWAEVQAEIFRRHGLPYSSQDQRRLMGWSAADVAQEVARLVAEGPGSVQPTAQQKPTAQQIRADVLEVEAEILTGRMPPIPGALALVQRISRAVPTAVASNSTAKILHTKMTATGIADHVHTWVSSDDVENAKPAADMYVEAARRLGVAPEQCLAVEDSPAGATAANRAGMRVIGLSHDGEPVPASWTISSLEQPEFMELVESWGW
ncbi:HAD family hydrolase [Kocuria sp.]|uniref:HAD family hydrolase n=1 Tax=Kocuria sp. TaxID=1871328 RepID=UPI0026DFE67B|nr:HAD family phosphatase [Kocuria sp.]MDO5618639.1 HAD family phosphatase [Kocuria sp.]